MFTLKLVFYGLVALVPSLNGEGAIVLFPTAQGIVDAGGCKIPEHKTHIFRVESPCSEKRSGERCLVEILTDPADPPAYMEPEKSVVNGILPAEGLRTMANGNELVVPTQPGQIPDISWIPNLARLNPESGNVRAECLVNPEECGIGFMFRTWQGNARACHLAHPRKAAWDRYIQGATDCSIPGPEGPILAYRFKTTGQPSSGADVFQAVADAFLIEIKDIEEAKINLFVVTSTGSTLVPVEFESDQKATLLFTNTPDHHESAEDECTGRGVDRHFEAYYHLGNMEPEFLTSRPLPNITSEAAPLSAGVLMECEPEVSLFEDLTYEAVKRLDCPKVKPHSIEVCSTGMFAGAVLPSTRSEMPRVAARAQASSFAVSVPPSGPTRARPQSVVGRFSRVALAPGAASPATRPAGGPE